MKTFKVLHFMKYVLVVLGLVFLLLSGLMYQNTIEFTKNAVTTKGMVTKVERKDNETTSYTIRFQDKKTNKHVEFISYQSGKLSEHKQGEEVNVLYQPLKPKEAVIDGFFSVWGLTMMFGYIGIMSLGFGLGSIIWFKRKAKKKQRLLSTGSPIMAEIQSIQKNKHTRINGKRPYQIHAQWQNPSTQKVHVFTSDNIWFDPASFIKKDQIQVYINKENPKTYYVDISFLPDMAD